MLDKSFARELKRYSRAKCAGHSIDNRPKEAEDRRNFDHWELDTVKGGKNMPTECLLAMTEWKSTVAVPNEIERRIGSDVFRRIFITMTCDEVLSLWTSRASIRVALTGSRIRGCISPVRGLWAWYERES